MDDLPYMLHFGDPGIMCENGCKSWENAEKDDIKLGFRRVFLELPCPPSRIRRQSLELDDTTHAVSKVDCMAHNISEIMKILQIGCGSLSV